jgi:hypothetical protein
MLPTSISASFYLTTMECPSRRLAYSNNAAHSSNFQHSHSSSGGMWQTAVVT